MPTPKTLSDLVEDVRAQGRVQEIGPQQLQHALEAGARHAEGPGHDPLLIDVREPAERERGYIADSQSLPGGVLERDLAKTCFPGPSGKGEIGPDQLDTPIVLYCGGGSRSMLAGQRLTQMGFTNVTSLAGGFSGWQRSGGAVDSE